MEHGFIFFFANLKNLKKYEFHFFASLKKTQNHGFSLLQA